MLNDFFPCLWEIKNLLAKECLDFTLLQFYDSDPITFYVPKFHFAHLQIMFCVGGPERVQEPVPDQERQQ